LEFIMKPSHAIALTATLAFAGLAAAHHSGAMFDSSKTMVLNGTITEFNWANPHSSIKIEVPGADGKPVVWAIEMNAPQNLAHDGWKRTTIKPGDKAAITVRPLRDGKPGGLYVSIKLADGKVLNGPDQAAAPAGASGAAGATGNRY
jgi:uncharacterized cupredoxin-like copper-binding protein